MKNFCKILFLYSLQLLFTVGYAQQISVDAVDFPASGRQPRMSFTVTALPKHRLFILDKPSRLVIDLKNTRLGKNLNQPPADHPVFSKVRAASKNDTDLRVVVDLKPTINVRDLSLNTDSEEQQLIINLVNKASVSAKPELKVNNEEIGDKAVIAVAKRKEVKKSAHNADNLVVVAIDAGHGGDDPGAQGVNGTHEKTVTFAIAQKLAHLIDGHPGMKAVMVRKGDYYVGLRNRMEIARAAKADLFISIHADAFQDASVRGASVYTLSRNGASSEAAHWLAEKENSADLVGGVSLNDKEDDLALVLLDLSQTATLEASSEVANKVLKSFAGVSALHKDSVQKAGFIVLKSPDIPSILVETAFISNPLEEQNLLSERYQDKMADAIFKGVYNYFKYSAPADSRIAGL